MIHSACYLLTSALFFETLLIHFIFTACLLDLFFLITYPVSVLFLDMCTGDASVA